VNFARPSCSYRLRSASCVEAAQYKQPRQGNQGEMAEGKTPTIRAAGPIEHQPDAERADVTIS
jgi:hypothetical protein